MLIYKSVQINMKISIIHIEMKKIVKKLVKNNMSEKNIFLHPQKIKALVRKPL